MNTGRDDNFGYLSKKCPECLTYIPLAADICPSCKQRVGKVTRTGMAKRPVNWNSYFMLILAVAAFSFYIWWAFVKD